MDTQTSYQPSQKPQKDNRVLIYSILAGALLLSWGYMFYNSRKATETESTLTSQNVAVTTELDEVKEMYNSSLFRLDSLIGENELISDKLTGSNTEITKLKVEINKILKNKNASDADLAKARNMISQLNGKIAGLADQVEQLQGENLALSSENTQIKEQKQMVEQNLVVTQSEKANVEKELETTKNIASTLKASNINIVAINETSGGKERETTSAKRADKLRINFNIDDNRLAQAGEKQLYVVVTDPTGRIVSYNGGDVFNMQDGASQAYTSRVVVNYEGGKSMPVSFDWKNDKTFAEGNYKIEIFHNGFKIGEQVRTLKKGGLFS